MINKKKRGFTIIEITVTISILVILIYAIQIGYSRYKENLILTEAATKIVSTVSMFRDKAYYENGSYTITFKMIEKKITVKDTKTFSYEVKLPSKPLYRIISAEIALDSLATTVYQTGNMSKAFTFYIFNSKKIAQYRISFYTFSQLKFLSINLYKNTNASAATYDNIEIYHKTSDAINHVGWTKE